MVISAGEKTLIRDSWAPVYAGDRFQIGVNVFTNFFKAYPAYVDLFPSLRGVSNPSGSYQLRGHAIRVITGINYFVDALDEDKSIVDEMLNNMARSHKPRGLTREQFAQFAPVLFDSIGVSGAARDAWMKYYNKIADGLFAKMAKL
uniref:Hemoglobin n=1 Tax=Hemipholis cordifera TaxID=1461317 RepID=W6FEV1_9ECHI|nr:hemoglobin [Hemipholis cordifera]AHN50405.1 hemoglobin [Hemipholis cordifera]